ncbi:hypothetical protein K438DRAFT_1995458 [Mycena galopus ATCC 62051]|nr:hypothetical protein K438DRAFT_1995458 [Mycena galopus ATCC 62051]
MPPSAFISSLTPASMVPIDPELLAQGAPPERHPDSAESARANGASSQMGDAARLTPSAPPSTSNASLSTDASTYLLAQGETWDEYEQRLATVKRKAPLTEAYARLGIRTPTSTNLERLRKELVKYWCVSVKYTRTAPSTSYAALFSSYNSSYNPYCRTAWLQSSWDAHRGELRGGVPLIPPIGANADGDHDSEGDEPDDEAALIEQYNVESANGADLLGYEDDSDEEEEEMDTSDEETAHDTFKRSVHVKANSMVKAWDIDGYKIKDNIVDEHVLLFTEHDAEREKLTQGGLPILGTRLGASQLKKLFFGALRICKPQDAVDPTLAQKRPAATFIVWEAIKNHMDEALERVRNGLDETEDAPDIRANLFLLEVTEEQLQKNWLRVFISSAIGPVFGYLAWTAQHASGNRGDDFCTLKLAELQPYEMQHPVFNTTFPSIVNPSYTVFIAHENPDMCPFGAFAFYHHYIHDEKNITETMEIDWTRNSSWRQVRILHGPKSPVTPYGDQNLYNLYCRVYASAGFTSRLKAHLPQHLLGYRQEEQRVDFVHTSKLGWKRNETYFDMYAPALPKQEHGWQRLDNVGTVTQMAAALVKSRGTSTAGGGATPKVGLDRMAAATTHGDSYTEGGGL